MIARCGRQSRSSSQRSFRPRSEARLRPGRATEVAAVRRHAEHAREDQHRRLLGWGQSDRRDQDAQPRRRPVVAEAQAAVDLGADLQYAAQRVVFSKTFFVPGTPLDGNLTLRVPAGEPATRRPPLLVGVVPRRPASRSGTSATSRTTRRRSGRRRRPALRSRAQGLPVPARTRRRSALIASR